MIIDIGSIPLTFDSESSGYTFITQDNPANADGIIDTIKIYTLSAMTGCIVGTFSVVAGDTLKCRDSVVIGEVTAGSEQTFNELSLEVKEGDYLGIYCDTGAPAVNYNPDPSVNYWYADGSHMIPAEEFGGSPYPGKMYLYGTGTGADIGSTIIKEIDLMEYPTDEEVQAVYVSSDATLKSYSEATIKTQGSYSLKGIATITDSLNKTLTRTISPTINLSNCSVIKFKLQSSRGGSNIKIGIHDNVGGLLEVTPEIISPDVWREVIINLSNITNQNKSAIDQITITVVNADAECIFYLDDIYAKLRNNKIISFFDC